MGNDGETTIAADEFLSLGQNASICGRARIVFPPPAEEVGSKHSRVVKMNYELRLIFAFGCKNRPSDTTSDNVVLLSVDVVDSCADKQCFVSDPSSRSQFDDGSHSNKTERAVPVRKAASTDSRLQRR